MNSSVKAGKNVVFEPVASKEFPGMFEVPSCPEYLVSKYGDVWYKRANRHVIPRGHKTSIGSYLAISARDGAGFRHMLVHLMVAEVFHGPPQGDRVFVNHKDGNKHNNRPDNLEWVTRSENLIHAYRSGLRTDKRSVLCIDHTGDGTREFFSMKEAGRFFGWAKHEVWKTLVDHREEKYLDRYTFMFPETESYTVRKRERKEQGGITRDIAAKNYRTGEVAIFPDQGSAELMTGVKRGTINYNLFLTSTPYRLVKGWVFKLLDDPADWPEYSSELVEISFNRKAGGVPVEITDLSTNTTCTYTSIHAFAESINEHPSIVRKVLKETPGRFKNYSIVAVK